ncbi:uncharacterized protein Dvir_GJ24155 [Drosophila virilis]|uniref:WAP domain-containing protein n=1 Tax=Drosophila virilis TaxID=7244 RepID=B4M149_DROVI|nr:uncharacterized protein Dvir_GJ24155 [Drosophila virilis]
MSICRRLKLLSIWTLLCVCIMRHVQARQDNIVKRNCSENGQYCQMHMDCCSRKCMTYMYKCAPRVPEKYPESNGSPTGLNSLPDFWWPLYHANIPLNEDLEIVTLQDDKTTTRTELVENSSQSAEIAGIAYDIVNPSSTAPTSSAPRCKRVGDVCSVSSECCTMRCHTYLHKCVT